MTKVISTVVEGEIQPIIIPRQYQNIPAQTLQDILDFVHVQKRPSGFVLAVLENDLRDAIVRADLRNRAELYNIVMFVMNHTPMPCWGSPEKVQEWLK